jgi:hypothetical protein
MKSAILYRLILAGSLCLLIVPACQKQDHYYKEFIKEGEIVYVGKVDSVVAHPGKNRIKLSWHLKDININKVKVYWNSRQDSLLLNVNGQDTDTMSVTIDALEERLYSFEIYTLDNARNSSIKVTAEANVYGERYRTNLLNRIVDNSSYKNNVATLNWFDGAGGLVRTELKYIDINGDQKAMYLLPEQNQIKLSSVNINLSVQYRSLYIPDSLAIDTFYTYFQTININ